MNKTEFLKELERSLDGEVSSGTVLDNLQYYNDYIRSELERGRSEEDMVVFDGYDEDGTEEYSEAPEFESMNRDNRPPRQPHFDKSVWAGWDLRFILITAAVIMTILVIAGFFFKAAISLLTSKWFWVTLAIWFAVRFIVRHMDMR